MIMKLDEELLKVTNEFADSVLSDIVKHLLKVVRDVEPKANKKKAIKIIQEWL